VAAEDGKNGPNENVDLPAGNTVGAADSVSETMAEPVVADEIGGAHPTACRVRVAQVSFCLMKFERFSAAQKSGSANILAGIGAGTEPVRARTGEEVCGNCHPATGPKIRISDWHNQRRTGASTFYGTLSGSIWFCGYCGGFPNAKITPVAMPGKNNDNAVDDVEENGDGDDDELSAGTPETA